MVLFLIIRWFARPAPKTMNAQYQEMTNEYLRVSEAILSLPRWRAADPRNCLEPTDRAYYRRFIRGLYRQGHGAKQAEKRWNTQRR